MYGKINYFLEKNLFLSFFWRKIYFCPIFWGCNVLFSYFFDLSYYLTPRIHHYVKSSFSLNVKMLNAAYLRRCNCFFILTRICLRSFTSKSNIIMAATWLFGYLEGKIMTSTKLPKVAYLFQIAQRFIADVYSIYILVLVIII